MLFMSYERNRDKICTVADRLYRNGHHPVVFGTLYVTYYDHKSCPAKPLCFLLADERMGYNFLTTPRHLALPRWDLIGMKLNVLLL